MLYLKRPQQYIVILHAFIVHAIFAWVGIDPLNPGRVNPLPLPVKLGRTTSVVSYKHTQPYARLCLSNPKQRNMFIWH